MSNTSEIESWGEFDDILMGIEAGSITPNQLVDNFRERAASDLGSAAVWCVDLANRIESSAIQRRAYGKDSNHPVALDVSTNLVRAMIDEYKNGDSSARLTIMESLVRPVLDTGNTNFGLSYVEKMSNPHLVGDIIRMYPILCPAFNLYSNELQDNGSMQRPDLLSIWLNQKHDSIFAATSVALNRDYAENVSAVMLQKPDLFRGAAHVVAARYDLMASWGDARYPNIERDSFLNIAYEYYVDEFAEMIRQEAAEAKWLPLNPDAPKWAIELP
jgi:hypothetical protein